MSSSHCDIVGFASATLCNENIRYYVAVRKDKLFVPGDPETIEVRESLQLAAIQESSLQNVTQILYYTQKHDVDKHIKLLELDEHLIETINKGDSLKFQGNAEDSVVLCTKNRTYDVQEAEISNSYLLTPKLNLFEQTNGDTDALIIKPCNVSGILNVYYEAEECEPKLEKLLTVLEPTSFKGTEYESSIPQELLYDWQKLVNEIQASEDQLTRAINDYFIVKINGYFRLISFEAEIRSVTLMLDLFDENSWEIDEIDREITYESLKEFIFEPIFNTLFRKYTDISDKTKEDGTPLYRYKEEECCKVLAKVLLAASPVTEYKQFMESWRIGTPEKMVPKEEHLYGIALIIWNNSTLTKEVVLFKESDLQKDIDERFNELFKMKDKWTIPEITPYVKNLTTPKLNVNALLTKYARCTTVNGIKYYNSKHGK